MAKRMVLMLVVLLALVGGLGFAKFKQVEAAIAQGKAYAPPPTAVTTVVTQKQTWPSTMTVIGTAAAIQGVTVSADLPGTIDKIHFESGQWVHEGDVLVELDIRQERAQLASLEAQRDLAKTNYDRANQLVGAGVISRSEYDTATAQQKATEAQVGDVRAAIARKTIHAPFSGVLGIRQVSLGQYLAAGQAIVSLQSLSPIYVNFGVPQQETPKVVPGHVLRVTNSDLPGMAFTGRITALDSVINEQTRNIQVQAIVTNKDNKLRPGMYRAGRTTTRTTSRSNASASFGDQLRALRRLRLHRYRYEGSEREFISGCSAAGGEAGRLAWRPGRSRLGPESWRRDCELRCIPAAQWCTRTGEQLGEAW